MPKTIIAIIIAAIIVIAIVILGIRFFAGNEDTWICQNGQWVKHGNPSSPMPLTSCGTPEPTVTPSPSATTTQESPIIVVSPQPGQTVTSPISIEGQARGSWFFEASAPLKLIDDKGTAIATGHIQATGDWMTGDFVPFTGSLSFLVTATTSATLILQNDNPSGDPKNAKEYRIPLTLSASQTMVVKAFFNNNNLDPQISCNKVFSVDRVIPKTTSVAKAALEELLKGTSEKETAQGYYTSINPGVKIQSLTILDGVAKADFDETLEKGVGGSCKVAAISAQIIQTLKQFSTVKSVIISINGRTEDILQP